MLIVNRYNMHMVILTSSRVNSLNLQLIIWILLYGSAIILKSVTSFNLENMLVKGIL